MQWGALILCPYEIGDKVWTGPVRWKIHFHLNCSKYLEYWVMGVDLGTSLH